VLGGQRRDDLLADPQCLLRALGLGQAARLAEPDQRPVEQLARRVQAQRTRVGAPRTLVVADRGQRVAGVEQQLPLGVPERGVRGVLCGQLGQPFLGLVERGPDPFQRLPAAAAGQPGQRPGLGDPGHNRGHAPVPAGQVGGRPGQRGGFPRVAVVQRHQRFPHCYPGPQPPVPGLVRRGPGGAEEGPRQALVTQVEQGDADQAGQLRGQTAQPLGAVERLPLRAHPVHVAEVEQDVAEQPERRHGHVPGAVPGGALLPLVEHRHRHGPAQQGRVQPAADVLDRTEEVAPRRRGRVGQQRQQHLPQRADVRCVLRPGLVGRRAGARDGAGARAGQRVAAGWFRRRDLVRQGLAGQGLAGQGLVRCGPGQRHRPGQRSRRPRGPGGPGCPGGPGRRPGGWAAVRLAA
jgi:hypothetical protein